MTHLLCRIVAGLVVDLGAYVSIATWTGALTSMALVLAPDSASTLVRLTFAGSYLGLIAWVLKTVLKIKRGLNVAGKW